MPQVYALVIDCGVYTRNRNFRLYGSSKRGKNAYLTLSSDNLFSIEDDANDQRERLLCGESRPSVLVDCFI